MKTGRTILFPLGAAAVITGVSSCGSAPPAEAPVAARAVASPAVTAPGAGLPPDSVPAIAQREVIRRQEQIRRMDDAALRASRALSEDDLEGAVGGYRRAIDGL